MSTRPQSLLPPRPLTRTPSGPIVMPPISSSVSPCIPIPTRPNSMAPLTPGAQMMKTSRRAPADVPPADSGSCTPAVEPMLSPYLALKLWSSPMLVSCILTLACVKRLIARVLPLAQPPVPAQPDCGLPSPGAGARPSSIAGSCLPKPPSAHPRPASRSCVVPRQSSDIPAHHPPSSGRHESAEGAG